MPPTKVDDNQLLDRLAEVFRLHGYEGASLRLISGATGLQRASLYHRFPGGKEEMVLAVLDRADERFANHVLAPLAESGDPAERVGRMARRLGKYYDSGNASCLLDTLSLGDATGPLREHVQRTFNTWLGAMSGVAREAGVGAAAARSRSTDAMVRVQGALVFSRATGDRRPFRGVLAGLPELLVGRS